MLSTICIHPQSAATYSRTASICSGDCAGVAFAVLVERGDEHDGGLALFSIESTIRKGEGWAVESRGTYVISTTASFVGWIPADRLDGPDLWGEGMHLILLAIAL